RSPRWWSTPSPRPPSTPGSSSTASTGASTAAAAGSPRSAACTASRAPWRSTPCILRPSMPARRATGCIRSRSRRDALFHSGEELPMPPERLLCRGFLFALALLLAAAGAAPVQAGVNVWTPIGPNGGPVFTLVVDPATPTTLYAATLGGVFKSQDG